jgi:hypothetical protein
MADDLQVTGGYGVTIATDDVNPAGVARHVQFMKLMSAQLNSTAPIDKVIGAIFGGVGTDTGLAMLGLVNDHIGAVAGVADGDYGIPVLDPSSRLATYTDGLRKRFKDEFSGAILDTTTKWTVTTVGAAGVSSVAGSLLTLTTGGTTSGDYVELLSRDTYQVPMRLQVVLSAISQRIVNQEFRIELVEENTATNVDPTDGALLLFNGVTNTTEQVATLCTGDEDGPNNWTGLVASSGVSKFEIDIMPDEVWFYNATTDSTAVRSGYAHQDRKSPDPNKRYRIRIRLKNTGAAASLTTVALDSVMLEDNAYLPVEIAHARGSNVGGEGLSVTLSSTTVSPNISTGNGFATRHHLISAATTNATLVKSSAAAVGVWVLTNTSAAMKFVKTFNKATAPIPGTDTPEQCYPIPAGQTVVIPVPVAGNRYATGLGYSITALAADNDTTAVAAGDVIVNIIYT